LKEIYENDWAKAAKLAKTKQLFEAYAVFDEDKQD
jgi:hypothetical protein